VTVVPAHLESRALTMGEPHDAVLLELRRTRLPSSGTDRDGPRDREQNGGEEGSLEERQDGEGLRFFAIQSDAGASSIQDFKGHMNIMAWVGWPGRRPRPLQSAVKRVGGNEQIRWILPTLRVCASSGNQQRTSAPNLAYSSDVDVFKLELLLRCSPILF
jgi:hypothetical protein